MLVLAAVVLLSGAAVARAQRPYATPAAVAPRKVTAPAAFPANLEASATPPQRPERARRCRNPVAKGLFATAMTGVALYAIEGAYVLIRLPRWTGDDRPELIGAERINYIALGVGAVVALREAMCDEKS